MTPSSRDTEKARLRAALRAARAGMAPADRQDQSEALGQAVVEYLTRRSAPGGPAGLRPDPSGQAEQPVIAAYLGVDPEPDTLPLLAELHSLGFGVVVPICEPDYRLSWADWAPGVALRRSVRAPVDEPVGPRRPFDHVAEVRLILVPALAVDATGHRVGQGGGYYDRFLARLPIDGPGAVDRLAVVYRSEVLPAGAIPAEPHDQVLAGAVTADGLLRFGRPGRPV